MYFLLIFKGGKVDKIKFVKYLGELKLLFMKYCKVKKVRLQILKRLEVRVIFVSTLGNIVVILLISFLLVTFLGLVLSNLFSRSIFLIKLVKSVKNFKRSYSVMISVNCVLLEKVWISG